MKTFFFIFFMPFLLLSYSPWPAPNHDSQASNRADNILNDFGIYYQPSTFLNASYQNSFEMDLGLSLSNSSIVLGLPWVNGSGFGVLDVDKMKLLENQNWFFKKSPETQRTSPYLVGTSWDNSRIYAAFSEVETGHPGSFTFVFGLLKDGVIGWTQKLDGSLAEGLMIYDPPTDRIFYIAWSNSFGYWQLYILDGNNGGIIGNMILERDGTAANMLLDPVSKFLIYWRAEVNQTITVKAINVDTKTMVYQIIAADLEQEGTVCCQTGIITDDGTLIMNAWVGYVGQPQKRMRTAINCADGGIYWTQTWYSSTDLYWREENYALTQFNKRMVVVIFTIGGANPTTGIMVIESGFGNLIANYTLLGEVSTFATVGKLLVIVTEQQQVSSMLYTIDLSNPNFNPLPLLTQNYLIGFIPFPDGTLYCIQRGQFGNRTIIPYSPTTIPPPPIPPPPTPPPQPQPAPEPSVPIDMWVWLGPVIGIAVLLTCIGGLFYRHIQNVHRREETKPLRKYCGYCRGSGRVVERCGECRGEGGLVRGTVAHPMIIPCCHCAGAGNVTLVCGNCNGTG